MLITNSRKNPGRFLFHRPCEKCRSSDALAVYEQEDGTFDATCYSCNQYFPSYEVSESDVKTSGRGEVRDLLTTTAALQLPILALEERGLSERTAQFYGVRSMMSGADGATPIARLLPIFKQGIHTGYKKRSVAEKFITIIGDGKGDVDLFGQHLFSSGGKRLYITEGEYDAMSLFQVLKELAGPAYSHLNPAVVSLPNGARSCAASLVRARDFLNKFSEIVLCFDQDEAGKKALEQAASVLDSSKIKVAKFSEKDANDMLLAGKHNELKWAVLTNAKAYTPSGIVTLSDIYDSVISEPEIGRPWAWPTLTRLTFGRSPGIYLIGAGVGVGKTEFFYEQSAFTVRDEGKPVGLFLMEETPHRIFRILAGKMLDKPLHRPDCEYTKEEYLTALQRFMYPYPLVYTFDPKWERDWDTIFTQIKHIIAIHDVKDIYIDPLTAIISHEDNTDRALHTIMDDLSTLTLDPYNAHVFVSSHLNEPPRDRVPHEEGGRVKESQFAGSRAMIRYSNYVIGLERNKQAEDQSERNTTTVRILKDRQYGSSTGETFDIFYNHDTGRYQEIRMEF